MGNKFCAKDVMAKKQKWDEVIKQLKQTISKDRVDNDNVPGFLDFVTEQLGKNGDYDLIELLQNGGDTPLYNSEIADILVGLDLYDDNNQVMHLKRHCSHFEACLTMEAQKAGGTDGQAIIYDYQTWQQLVKNQGTVESFNSTAPTITDSQIAQRGAEFQQAKNQFLFAMGNKKLLEAMGADDKLNIFSGLGYITFDIQKKDLVYQRALLKTSDVTGEGSLMYAVGTQLHNVKYVPLTKPKGPLKQMSQGNEKDEGCCCRIF